MYTAGMWCTVADGHLSLSCTVQGVPYTVCVTGLSVGGPGTPGCETCFSKELSMLCVCVHVY